jgi:hypothetical protein
LQNKQEVVIAACVRWGRLLKIPSFPLKWAGPFLFQMWDSVSPNDQRGAVLRCSYKVATLKYRYYA